MVSNDLISGKDALTDAPASTDEFLVSDAGVLKRIDASLVGRGKLLQVVSAEDATERSTSSSSFSDIVSASITPSATSSKILIMYGVVGIRRDNTNGYMTVKIIDGSGFSKSVGHAMLYTNTTSTLRIGSANGSFLHSANTTSQKTYTVQFNSANGGGVIVGDNGTTQSTITLMEIAG